MSLPMTRDEIDQTLRKAQQLEPDDEDRLGILEYVAQWFVEEKESRRCAIEHEIRKRARRLAY